MCSRVRLGLMVCAMSCNLYVNFAYTYSGHDPSDILQFDRLNPSTEIPPIEFPQFNSVDSIDSWTILRLGVRNRLQTRRDSRTLNWLELDSFRGREYRSPGLWRARSSTTKERSPMSSIACAGTRCRG